MTKRVAIKKQPGRKPGSEFPAKITIRLSEELLAEVSKHGSNRNDAMRKCLSVHMRLLREGRRQLRRKLEDHSEIQRLIELYEKRGERGIMLDIQIDLTELQLVALVDCIERYHMAIVREETPSLDSFLHCW